MQSSHSLRYHEDSQIHKKGRPVTTPHILQAGLHKSGNLWIHETIKKALKLAGKNTTPFVTQHAKLNPNTSNESKNSLFGHDVIDIEDYKMYARISLSNQLPIDDLSTYISSSSLVWTHSLVTPLSQKVYSQFDKVIYIIRDPRDAAVSMAHFTQTDARKQQFKNPDHYLQKKLAQNIRQWMRHVAEHIELSDKVNMHFVFYERFLTTFDQELRALLDYLEVDLTQAQIDELTKEVSFDEMKKKRPNHVREGGSYKWIKTLAPNHQKSVLKIAQPLLTALNYPLNTLQLDQLPSKPDHLTPQEKIQIRKQTHRKRSQLKSIVLKFIRANNQQ
jgi:aryl sulfotransferase